MIIRPIELKQANRFVMENHRHHQKVIQHRFSIGLYNNDKLIGVAICGRPLSRFLDNGLTLEVSRLCTDGTRNACSKLYSSCARIAKELGYNKIQTYILETEGGISLIASGWLCEEKNIGGKAWNTSGKVNRSDTIITLFGEEKKYPNTMKQRWSKVLNQSHAKMNDIIKIQTT